MTLFWWMIFFCKWSMRAFQIQKFREHKIIQQDMRAEAETESDPAWVALLGHIRTCLNASLMLGCVLHWQWVSPRYTGSDSAVETEEEQQGACLGHTVLSNTHAKAYTYFAKVSRWARPKRNDLEPNQTYWILKIISKNLFLSRAFFFLSE